MTALALAPSHEFLKRLEAAKKEHTDAKAAWERGEPGAEDRYSWALYMLDRLQGMFPFVRAGLADVQA